MQNGKKCFKTRSQNQRKEKKIKRLKRKKLFPLIINMYRLAFSKNEFENILNIDSLILDRL